MSVTDKTELTFQFQRPIYEGVSQAAKKALGMSALSEKLANEARTRLNHPNGRAENVAEHSLMLAKVAPELAAALYPALDANLVARFATVHDDVETYVGDTATDIITEDELELKYQREQEGIAQLKREYQDMPEYLKLVEEYEKQEVPEARFVRLVDKLMPVLQHLASDGASIRATITKDEQLDPKHRRQSVDGFRKEYPEFEELIQLREELVKLMADTYL